MHNRPFFERLPLARIFGIDRRTLALFRVALALLLLSDLWTRARDVSAFYSDTGVLPRAAQIEIYGNEPWLLSLHLMSGLVAVQIALFTIAAGCALALLVGFRTWTATFLSWVLLMSLHNRNPMTLQGGDVVLRMLLFWSLFLPLGACFSVDRSANSGREDDPTRATTVFSTGTLGILLQVGFIYWFAAALKTDASWRTQGSALYYALSIDQLVKPLGQSLLAYPDLLRFLTFATLYLERYGPFLAFLPFWRVRVGMALVFIGFHIIMALCLTLGIFPAAAITAWLLFIPREAWDALGHRARKSPALSHRITQARSALQNLALKAGTFSPANSASRGVKSNFRRALLSQIIAAFALIYLFVWNLRTVDFATYSHLLPPGGSWIGVATRTDQSWDMFAPFPLKEDGWFIAAARLPDGRQVDLLHPDAPLSFQKPALLSASYRDALWQKYQLNLWAAANAAHRAYYVGYLTREWNQAHPEAHLKALQLIFMREDTLPPGQPSQPRKIVVWQQNF